MSYASWSSSLPVPLLGPRGRKRARTPARSIRLGRGHRAGGVTPVEARHQPHNQNQQPPASWIPCRWHPGKGPRILAAGPAHVRLYSDRGRLREPNLKNLPGFVRHGSFGFFREEFGAHNDPGRCLGHGRCAVPPEQGPGRPSTPACFATTPLANRYSASTPTDLTVSVSAVLGNECGNPTHDPEVDRKAVPARSVSLHPGQIGATTNTRRARSTTRHRLGLGDRLHRRARALVLLSHRKRIDERALLAEAKHVSRLAKASAYRFGIDPVELPVTHVRVGVCDDRLQGCPRGLARSATRSRTPCRAGWGRSAVRSRSKVDPDGSVDRPLRTAAVSASTMSFRSPGLPSSCIERCTSNSA